MNKLLLNMEPIKIDISNIVSGSSFLVYDDTMNWDTQSIIINMDLTTCSSTNENIISIGSNIYRWNSGYNLHCYYTKITKSFQLNLCTTSGYTRASVTIDSSATSDTTLILNSSGVTLNGSTVSFTSSNLSSWLTNLKNYSTIQIGSQEGNTRSKATYKSMKIMATLK